MTQIHFNSKYHKILTKKFLYKEYIINKKSCNQIADKINCCNATIWKYLKKYKIKTRTPKQARKLLNWKGKYSGEKSWSYIDGRWSKQHYCKDCEKELSKGVAKRCNSCANKHRWQDKEFREKTIKAMCIARNLSPNELEKLLIKLLNKLLPKQYNFVGNGKLIVGGFIPDFVNKANNKIIEMYGDYWHNRKDWKERDKHRVITYKKLGYKTLIIWEHELKNLDKVKNKILKFNQI